MHNNVIHTALACFASISLIVLLRNTALRMGLVDYPGGRKLRNGHCYHDPEPELRRVSGR